MTRIGFLEVSANPLLYLQQCTRPLQAAAYSRVVVERKHVGQTADYSLRNCPPPMNVLSPLIPAWKAISISLRTSNPPCAVIVQPGRSLAKAAGFPGFYDQKASYTSHGPHRYGDFRLFPTGMTVFPAACCCPAILALAFRLSGFVGSTDAFTGSLSRGLARHPWKYPLQKVSRKSMQPQVFRHL